MAIPVGRFPNVPFTLAVSSEMVFRDLAPVDSIRRIHDLGYQVEIWDWTKHDIKAIAATGATFSSMTGYVTGTLADDDGANELIRTARQSIPIAKELGIPRLNLHGTGLDGRGLPVKPCEAVTGEMWLKARETLDRIADLGAEAGVTFVLENLNAPVDHPDVPFGRAEDCLALVSAVNKPGLRLMLDLYHAADRRREPDRPMPQGAPVRRRNPGRRRARPLRTGNRRDQLSRHRQGASWHGLQRCRRTGRLGVR